MVAFSPGRKLYFASPGRRPRGLRGQPPGGRLSQIVGRNTRDAPRHLRGLSSAKPGEIVAGTRRRVPPRRQSCRARSTLESVGHRGNSRRNRHGGFRAERIAARHRILPEVRVGGSNGRQREEGEEEEKTFHMRFLWLEMRFRTKSNHASAQSRSFGLHFRKSEQAGSREDFSQRRDQWTSPAKNRLTTGYGF